MSHSVASPRFARGIRPADGSVLSFSPIADANGFEALSFNPLTGDSRLPAGVRLLDVQANGRPVTNLVTQIVAGYRLESV